MEVFEKYGKIIIENGFVKEIESDYSGNGYIFKDMENFHNKKGICYISEYGLEEFEDAIDEGERLTIQDIIDCDFGVDYRSCIEKVDNHLRDYGIRTENAVLERIAESILCSCDWQYFDTELDQQNIDDLEEWVKTLEKEIDEKK